jgi:cobalt-zinc-cadmium efflux system outer membrane protein
VAALPCCAAPPPRPVDLDGIAERRDLRENHVVIPALQGLSLEVARELLPVLDPELQLAFSRWLPAHAGREHAGLWPDPTLNVDLANALSGGALDELDVLVQVPLAIAGRQQALANRLDAQARLALARAESQLFERARELEADWVAWSLALAEERSNRALAEDLEGPLERIEVLVESGNLGIVESGLLRLARLDAERRAVAASQRAQDLELRILHALGLRARGRVAFEPLVIDEDPREPEGSVSRELPELIAAAAALEVADAAVQEAHRARFVEPRLGAGAGREGGGRRVLFGLQVPVPLWNRGLGALAQAVARREVAAQTYELAYERALEREERARRALRAARGRRAPVEEGLLPLAREQESILSELLTLGDLRPFLLVDAMERRQAAELERLQLLGEEMVARMELEALQAPYGTNAEKER